MKQAGDDAQKVGVYDPLKIIEKLSFDHDKMLRDYLQWTKKKGTFWSSR